MVLLILIGLTYQNVQEQQQQLCQYYGRICIRNLFMINVIAFLEGKVKMIFREKNAKHFVKTLFLQ